MSTVAVYSTGSLLGLVPRLQQGVVKLSKRRSINYSDIFARVQVAVLTHPNEQLPYLCTISQ